MLTRSGRLVERDFPAIALGAPLLKALPRLKATGTPSPFPFLDLPWNNVNNTEPRVASYPMNPPPELSTNEQRETVPALPSSELSQP